MIFRDRTDAGKQLARKLLSYKKRVDTVVLGLARGGVVVAYEIAQELSLPLNVLVARKIGAPDNPELAIGAVAEDGEVLLDQRLIQLTGASPSFVQEAIRSAKQLANRRLAQYRQVAPLGDLQGKSIILVDDGVATGATMLVEIQSLRKKGTEKIIAAVPVAARESWDVILAACDDAVCLDVEETFMGISEFYDSFPQVEDATVLSLLK